MIFQIVSNFTRLTAHEITYNNFEISLVVFMPNITANHAITYIQISSVTLKDCVGGLWLGRDKNLHTRTLLPILHTSCELGARPEADTFLSRPQWGELRRIVN